MSLPPSSCLGTTILHHRELVTKPPILHLPNSNHRNTSNLRLRQHPLPPRASQNTILRPQLRLRLAKALAPITLRLPSSNRHRARRHITPRLPSKEPRARRSTILPRLHNSNRHRSRHRSIPLHLHSRRRPAIRSTRLLLSTPRLPRRATRAHSTMRRHPSTMPRAIISRGSRNQASPIGRPRHRSHRSMQLIAHHPSQTRKLSTSPRSSSSSSSLSLLLRRNQSRQMPVPRRQHSLLVLRRRRMT